VALQAWTHAATGSQVSGGAEQALIDFHTRVDRYAALHRRLEGPLPSPRIPARDGFTAVLERQYLASSIRRARPSAHLGDIIDPAVGKVLRRMILTALAAPGGAALAERFRRRAARPGLAPVINEPYSMDAGTLVPDLILRQLPALAEDLEYRAVNTDLVLWDVHAEIIVDVLPDAFLTGINPGS
jgi:hypothetical protein